MSKPEGDVFKPGKGKNSPVAIHGGDDVAAVVTDLNRTYALILIGSKAVVMREGTDADGDREIQFLAIAAFEQWWRNHTLWMPNMPRPTTYAEAWLGHALRRQYEGVVFSPRRDVAGYFNLWQGFSVDPDPHGKFTIYADHILNNVCHGNQDHYKWVMGWFAQMIQNPHEKLGNSLVLRGKQGCGKTKVGEVIGRLFPAHYNLVDDPRYITGNFNSHMASCLLLQADEGFWAGDKTAEGRLKGLVTSNFQMIEKKGVDAIKVKNLVRLMITSNSEWVVPVGNEERRFCILDVGDGVLQNREYFGEMEKELTNGGLSGLLHYLLNFDLSSVDLQNIFTTDALLEQKIGSMEPVEAWWFEALRRGAILKHHVEWAGGPSEADQSWVATEGVFSAYIKWSDRIGIRRHRVETQLGSKLRKWVPGIIRKQRMISYQTEDGFSALRRAWCYRFPDLETCRDAFEDILKQKINWEE